MTQSLFFQYVEKYFRLVIGKITERFNDQKQEETYLHKTMLTEEYSADLNWGSTSINNSIVAADVVAMDSSLPLKKRSAISVASGLIPKLGIKKRKGEKLISDINVMIARGADEATVASKVFDDTTAVIKAMDVRKEIMFQQGLSTGVILTNDANDTKVGVRADFGYLASNIIVKTTDKWPSSTAVPVSDLHDMFDKANDNGDTINHVYLSRKYFDYIRTSDEGKQLVASYLNQVFTAKTNLPTPSRKNLLEALADEFGAEFHIVNSTFKVENPDGTTTNVKPWEEANIVGVSDAVVGRLVYGTLAEETNPVADVAYQKSGSHVLVAKYSKTDPLEEFTTAQALCIPVIDGGESIYSIHANG